MNKAYSSMSTEELAELLWDMYKDVMYVRPRHVDLENRSEVLRILNMLDDAIESGDN